MSSARGEVRAGQDLREVIVDALRLRSLIEGLHSRYSRSVVEQAAIAGALNPELNQHAEQSQATAAEVAKRLDLIAEETERGWTAVVAGDGGLRFERMVRGVKEVASLDMALIGSSDARHIDQLTPRLKEIYRHSAGAAPQGRRRWKSAVRARFSTRSSPAAARACRCSATRVWAK